MLARTWHGVVPKSKSEAYLAYMNETGIQDYRTAKGNLGVTILRRDDGELTHYLLLTFWDSEESIAAFAGQELTKARYYPEDKEYLIELEPFVKHYEVLETPGQIS